jgi:hypothetical protein
VPFRKTGLQFEKCVFPVGESALGLFPLTNAVQDKKSRSESLSRTQLSNFVIGQKYMPN